MPEVAGYSGVTPEGAPFTGATPVSEASKPVGYQGVLVGSSKVAGFSGVTSEGAPFTGAAPVESANQAPLGYEQVLIPSSSQAGFTGSQAGAPYTGAAPVQNSTSPVPYEGVLIEDSFSRVPTDRAEAAAYDKILAQPEAAQPQQERERSFPGTPQEEALVKKWEELDPTIQSVDPRLLSETYSLLRNLDYKAIQDEADRSIAVKVAVDWAILATVQAKTSTFPHGDQPGVSPFTKEEFLEWARLRINDHLREERSIPESSRNTIYRDAEYYLAGRFMTHQVAREYGVDKENAAVMGPILNDIYSIKKSIVDQRSDPGGLPTSEPGGSEWTAAGGKDALLEEGAEKGIPFILKPR